MEKIKKHPYITMFLVSIFLIFIVYRIFYFHPALDFPKVTSITAAEYASGSFVLESSDILVTFEDPVSVTQQKKVTFSIYPSVPLSPTWVNEKQVRFSNMFLVNDIEYTLVVFYEGREELYRDTFKTNPFSQNELVEQALLQTQEDLNFAAASDQLHVLFPWYDLLPIDTEEFVIVYDYELESFRIRLKINTWENDDVKVELQRSALERLDDLGINPTEYDYHFLYLDN